MRQPLLWLEKIFRTFRFKTKNKQFIHFLKTNQHTGSPVEKPKKNHKNESQFPLTKSTFSDSSLKEVCKSVFAFEQ